MKKRLIIITLTLALLLSMAVPSFAASSFSDITDSRTAAAVEVLRLMGVIEGAGGGTYNPNGTLTRAEFSKLAVVSMHTDADFSKYKNMTIFPDLKASAWFAPYVNMASKGLGIISGCPDGTFKPNNIITAGEAVTLIIRLIGYKDSEVGGVWPYGHFAYAKTLGLLNGTQVSSASDTITRGDAAKIFVNAINADARGKNTVFTMTKETVLKSVDIGAKTLKTSDSSYKTLKSISGNNLIGKSGYVVLNNKGMALTFLPKSVIDYEAASAVIIKTSGDAGVLTTLAGRSDYTIYKNGALITKDKLKAGDVAIYREDENKILVCDTKVSVLYENVQGSPAEPTSITALGGKQFDVLPSAVSSIANYKPGSHIGLSLTVDGKIAAVSGSSYSSSTNNAVFVVSLDGKANMVCGNEVMEFNLPVTDTSLYGKAATLNFAYPDRLSFVALTGNIYGSLKADEKKLGSRNIADNALIFENGELVSLSDVTTTNVSYARENANGEIDLVVLYDSLGGKLVAGKGSVVIKSEYLEVFGSTPVYCLELETAGGKVEKKTNFYDETVKDAFMIAHSNGNYFTGVSKLNYIDEVDKSAFENSDLINLKSGTMSIAKEVACLNKDLERLKTDSTSPSEYWTSLEDALAYGRTFTLYGINGTVYVITYSY
ncbi:MAG: S-layer homology domain-containing protein [Clostridia bacterium]|nr:S-layer homology domain-containing protein [Clostridia bacterium]